MIRTLLIICVASLALGSPSPFSPYCAGQSPGNQQTEDSNLGPVKLDGSGSSIDEKTNCPGGIGVQWFPTQIANLAPGSSYTLSFDVTTCGNAYQRKNAAWIDFNGNNVFDSWEKIGEADVGATAGSNVVTFEFIVPKAISAKGSDAINTAYKSPDGQPNTRLRVVVVENGFDPMDPCLAFPYGGLKDFPIVIGGGGLDVGGILLIVVLVGGLVGLGVAVLVFWKVKQVPPKEFLAERVMTPCVSFCQLAKGGVLFLAHKMKCAKKGETGDYDEL